MLLRRFRVEKFRNIIDSQFIEAQNDVTCLVGKNESGKTTLLQALYRINPAYATPFDLEAEYPRWLLIQDRKSGVAAEAVPILAVFELEEDDIAIVEELVGPEVLAEPFITVGLKYDGDRVVSLQLDETRAVTNLLARVTLQDVTRLEVENCPDLLILQQAMEGQREKANKGPPEPGFAWVNPEELDALQVEITRILRGCSSLWQAIVALLRQRLPTFFYFDDYSTLPGRINLSELRSAQHALPGQNDLQTARALLQLAGTDISALANENYEFRKAELEAVSNDLTRQAFEYWTQNTDLSVEIDVDKETVHTPQGQTAVAQLLDVRVKDQRHGFTNNFSQRSSGFQWFFSFLASVVTVIDHTRRILHKEWPDITHSIRTEFDAARQVFLTDGRLVVVRDLRNFCLHRSLPNIVGQINFGEESSVTNRALLSTASLLEWDGWKAAAKAYLDEADETIELKPLVVHYVEQALQLHNAVMASIRTYEADVLAPWQALAEEHHTHVSEIRRRTDPSYLEPEPASDETSPQKQEGW